jgi:hypothetical protein
METRIIETPPSTVLGVLEQFGTSKEQINKFASLVLTEVENGNADPLKLHIYCKTLEAIADKIKAGIKDAAMTEAAKYGQKEFEFMGASVAVVPVSTQYDFKVCNYPAWEECDFEISSATERRKIAEAFLKAVKEPFTMIDDRTGEVVTIHPPVKRQIDGIKITIK